MKIFKHVLSPAMIVALLGLFFALGGVGSAANGDKLTLGQSNGATSTTSLSAAVAGSSALKLSNTNAAAGSSALSLNVAQGHPPLVVISGAGKATNLNADKLDGIEANGFWKLGGNSTTDNYTLGPMNNHSLWFIVNGQKALRLFPDATSPIIVGGYSGNSVDPNAFGATISGGGMAGSENTIAADGTASTIGGGLGNSANGAYSIVGGGAGNAASGFESAVTGGQLNTASANYSTVPGGFHNTASADFSLAVGSRAKATQAGAFVWGDNTAADVTSPAANTFSVRASGGVWLGTNSSPSIGANRFIDTSTGGYLTSGGVWTDSSDRALKHDFRRLDKASVLEKVAHMPITSWSYKAEQPGIRHIGPVAQDFYSAFGLGLDNKHITTIDEGGVALAAIQGLYRQNQALMRRLLQLERQVRRLTSRGH